MKPAFVWYANRETEFVYSFVCNGVTFTSRHVTKEVAPMGDLQARAEVDAWREFRRSITARWGAGRLYELDGIYVYVPNGAQEL